MQLTYHYNQQLYIHDMTNLHLIRKNVILTFLQNNQCNCNDLASAIQTM